MAPHVHRLSAYASQRLVSLFDMLSRKYVSYSLHNSVSFVSYVYYLNNFDQGRIFMGLYNFVLRYSKLVELKSNKIQIGNGESRGDNLPEDTVVTIVHPFVNLSLLL